MVKVHGKQSKRLTLRRKYNVQKKCREGKRKKAKISRKIKKMGIVKIAKREPALPNLFPYKKQVIDDMQQKEREFEEKKREAKLLRRKAKKELAKQQLDKKEGKEGEGDAENYVDEIQSKIVR